MQKTKLIRRTLSHDYGTPVDAIINKILDADPRLKLVQITVIGVKNTSCLLLCTFESTDD